MNELEISNRNANYPICTNVHRDDAGKKLRRKSDRRIYSICSLSELWARSMTHTLEQRSYHRGYSYKLYSVLLLSILFNLLDHNVIKQANAAPSYVMKIQHVDPINLEVSRYGEIPELYHPISEGLKRSSNRQGLKRVAKSILSASKDIQHNYQHLPSTGGRRNGFVSSNIKFGGSSSATTMRKLLPNGPPPFIPPALFLPHTTLAKALHVLKQTKAFKSMYKSKVYYLFLDLLRQLALLADGISKKKIVMTQANLALIESVVSKLAMKGGQLLKLKWPMVLLNPHFLKGILADPTFLVTLFHSLEVAYMAMPLKAFWLKPMLKLVRQPSPEKEEQTWWRRKSFYDTLNGHGSSELQPNLKTVHFRNPGSPAKFAFPHLVKVIHTVAKKPPPNPTHNVAIDGPYALLQNEYPNQHDYMNENAFSFADKIVFNAEQDGHPTKDIQNDHYMTPAQEEAFLNNQIGHNGKANYKKLKNTVPTPSTQFELTQQPEAGVSDLNYDGGQSSQMHEQVGNNAVLPVVSQDDWLTHPPKPEQLMSQDEFNSLDDRDKDLILSEARQRFEESRLTNELIKQHDDLIASFANRKDDIFTIAADEQSRFKTNIRRSPQQSIDVADPRPMIE